MVTTESLLAVMLVFRTQTALTGSRKNMLIFLQISLIGLKRVRVDKLNVASYFLSINEVVPLAGAEIARNS